MVTELIGKATRLASSGCERVRSLGGTLDRAAAGIGLVNKSVPAVIDAAHKLEALAAGNFDDVTDLLGQSVDKLKSRALSLAEAGPVGRALRSVGASVSLAESLYGKVTDSGASLVASAGKVADGIGGQLGPALGGAKTMLSASTLADLRAAAASIKVVEPSPLTNPSAALLSSLPDSSKSSAHLLVLTSGVGESYYFGLSTAAYDSLRRQTSYTIASQDRLSRRAALQGVAKGGETVSVSGAIFTRRAGAKQLNRLRAIGYALKPLLLTTGYGESLGQWYMTKIDEEQSGLFADGVPRKQTFTLEFQRYGEDYSDV